MPSPWTWEPRLHRYRGPGGRFIGATQMVELRDEFLDAATNDTTRLANRLATGDISLRQWETQMRDVIRNTHIDQYVMARGGRNVMTQSDWGRIGRLVRDQYKFLNRFSHDIFDSAQRDAPLSEGQVAVRSSLYVGASSEAFANGRAIEQNMPILPRNPGDGTTICLTNCTCSWSTQRQGPNEWSVTWVLNTASQNCQTCLDRADAWIGMPWPADIAWWEGIDR